MKNTSLKLNVVLNGMRILMQMIFPLISFPYASRTLLPSGIGAVNFSNSIIAYFVLIASLGISTYAIREGAKIRNDKKKISIFVQEIFIINVITTLISYIIFITLIHFSTELQSYKLLLLICSLSIICTPLGIDWLYGAIEDYKYITVRSILFQFVSLILLFVFVKKSTDIAMYAFITVFATVGSNICNLIHSRKIINWSKLYTNEYNFKRHLKPIFTIFGLNLACNVYMNLDKTMLGLLTNDTQVGLYTTAYKVVGIVVSLINSIGTVMLPRISYELSNNNEKQYKNLLKYSFNIMLILAVPMTIGSIVYSKHIILILSGEEYINAILPMQILSLLILLSGLGNAFSIQIFIANGYEKNSLYASTLSAIINLVFNFLLIPKLHIVGAAISTILSELAALILCIIMANKITSTSKLLKNIPLYIIVSLSIIPISIICNKYIGNMFSQLLFGILFSSIFYCTILYFLNNEFIKNFFNLFVKKLKLK